MMLMITAAVSITNVTVFLIEVVGPLLFLFGIFFSFHLIACLWIMKVHIMKMIEDLLLLLQIQLLQYLFELSVLLTFFVIGCYASVNECPTPLFLTLNTRTILAHDYLRQAVATCTPPLFPSMEKKDRGNENPLSPHKITNSIYEITNSYVPTQNSYLQWEYLRKYSKKSW
jgi:hypothetical protein